MFQNIDVKNADTAVNEDSIVLQEIYLRKNEL